jgi:hypothetical protein
VVPGLVGGRKTTLATENMINCFAPSTTRETSLVNAVVLDGSLVQRGSPVVGKLGNLESLSIGKAFSRGLYALPINVVEHSSCPIIGYEWVMSL